MSDTIFALSTAPGRAGVAIVRISGPQALAAGLRLSGRTALPVPRRCVRATFRHPLTGALLDDGLWVYFPAPNSFTGEDVVELHLHGSKAVIEAVCGVLASQPALRSAEPGEFTRRAFVQGRMDLTQADGLADLLAAETEIQREQALMQLQGNLWRLYDAWRTALIEQLALLEAYLDFPDEDLPPTVLAELTDGLRQVAAAIRAHLSDQHRGERRREGIRIALVGAPNAGKSSLLNALARRDVAIVTPEPGTTRDVIEAALDLGGYPVLVADTAGLRDDPGVIEAEGIRRARLWLETADFVVVLAAPDVPRVAVTMQDGQEQVQVWNKMDLATCPDAGVLTLSTRSGEGVDALLNELTCRIAARFSAEAGRPFLTHARYRAALETCLQHLASAEIAPFPELMTEDVRLAMRAIGRITGAVDIEAVLDVVFSRFCIGK
jgi:tRNA modification GTPase